MLSGVNQLTMLVRGGRLALLTIGLLGYLRAGAGLASASTTGYDTHGSPEGGLVLAGGVLDPITAAGFEFTRVDRPKEPMPAMGKVPPS